MFTSRENLRVTKLMKDFNEFKTSGRCGIIKAIRTKMITILQKYLDE